MSNVTSQSELTTKEIVEQAISDYHESILPYLNGMVPTIANKFDKANLYSEDEQIIGRWIDGKPVYQKVVRNLNIDIYYNSFVNSGIDASNVEQCVSCKGFDKNGSFLGEILCSTYGTGQRYTTWSLQTTRNGSNIVVSFLVLQYTKTTDEAIAIGSDTDYSLEEKIVGTWTNGKNLYQKTGTIRVYSTTDWETNKDIGITNVNEVVNICGYCKLNNDLFMPINVSCDVFLTVWAQPNGKFQVYTNYSRAINQDISITALYTKTTD